MVKMIILILSIFVCDNESGNDNDISRAENVTKDLIYELKKDIIDKEWVKKAFMYKRKISGPKAFPMVQSHHNYCLHSQKKYLSILPPVL